MLATLKDRIVDAYVYSPINELTPVELKSDQGEDVNSCMITNGYCLMMTPHEILFKFGIPFPGNGDKRDLPVNKDFSLK